MSWLDWTLLALSLLAAAYLVAALLGAETH